MTTKQYEEAARACIETFNKGTSAWVDTFYSDHVEWIELPRQISPAGRHGDRAVMRQTFEQTDALFPDRRMTILNLIAQDDQVVMELEWQATAARTIGNMAAGTPLRARIANFLKYNAQGKIIKHVDYVISLPGTPV